MSIEGKDLVIEEILALLESEELVDNDGFTSKELGLRWGHTEKKLSNAIDKMLRDGLIVPVKLTRRNRVGVVTTVYGYKMTDKAHERAAAQSGGMLDQTS